MAIINGTVFSDNGINAAALVGTDFDDYIDGGFNADVMRGGKGNDTYVVDRLDFPGLFFITGNDTILENPNEGNDTVVSSNLSLALRDFAYGPIGTLSNLENIALLGSLALSATGDSGSNRLDGSQNSAANRLEGGAGNDVYVVGSGDIVVEGANAGADTVQSALINVNIANLANVENILLLGAAALAATGNARGNSINGAGNGAANVLSGLGGNDVYIVGAGDRVVEAINGGIDTIVSNLISVNIASLANVEHITLSGSLALSATGNALGNVINGLANSGANVLTGANGNDIYRVGAGDKIVETSILGSGIDTVMSSTISLALAGYANVERAQLTGNANLNLGGTARNDVLIGNSGNNILNGLAGADTMTGGLGNDTYYVNSESDRVFEGLNGGSDTIISSLRGHYLQSNVENLTLTNPLGTGFGFVFGNALNNRITGTSGNDLAVHGGAGNDTIDGGGGFDFLNGDAGNDTLYGGTGNDSLNGGTGGDILFGGAGKDSLAASNGADTLYGGVNSDGFFFDKTVIGTDPGGAISLIRDFSFAQGDEIFLKNYPDLRSFADLVISTQLVFDPEPTGIPGYTRSISVDIVYYDNQPIVAVYTQDAGNLNASHFTFGF